MRLPFMRKGKERKAGEGRHEHAHEGGMRKAASTGEVAELRRKVAVYRRIIARYEEKIAEFETKTITELKSLINPNDEVVLRLRDGLLERHFHPYIYEKDFEKAAQIAFDFVLKEVASEELPVDFWLTPRDVIELGAADEMDKAVLLCSLLRAMDCSSAKVVVESDGERHVFVSFGWGDRYHILDPVHGTKESGERKDVLRKLFGDGTGKTVYEFNDSDYDVLMGGEA